MLLAPHFPVTIDEAVQMQQLLRQQVKLQNDFGELRTIAGIDASYDIVNNITRAFVVVLDLKTMTVIDRAKAEQPTRFPYVPGFLSFRETPTILDALAKLSEQPDIVMVDGQGVAHPRRFGIACHVGVLTGLPGIGVAKSRLSGFYTEPALEKGATTILGYKTEQLGTVLRSKTNVKPLFISPGHRIDQATALAITRNCLTTYRLPEPTRLADKWSKTKTAQLKAAPSMSEMDLLL